MGGKAELCLSALRIFIDEICHKWDRLNVHLSGVWENKGWCEPPSSFEINYFIKGGSLIDIKGQRISTQKNDLFFFDSRLFSSCEDSKFKLYYITFSAMDQFIEKELEPYLTVLSQYLSPYNIEGMEPDFDTIFTEFTLRHQSDSLILKQHFIAILVKLYKALYKETGLKRGA